MADTLPVDTASPTLAQLPRPAARYTPSAQELARQAAAAEHLAQVAAERDLAPVTYERHGIDIEWHHQIDDPAVPPLLVRPYLTTGGQP